MSRKKQQKQVYTQEFRDTAIKLAMEGDKSTAEVARELGLPEWKLYSWVQAWNKKNKQEEQSSSKSAEDKLKALEKRYKALEQENEILKKAAAYFAKTLL
ncbi:MAG TPA: transposase [Candidatus Obscuribacter sp.]|nr:transposase [Candidatus Obscuribacter sp.]